MDKTQQKQIDGIRKATEARRTARQSSPRCTNPLPDTKGHPKRRKGLKMASVEVCGTPTIQNEPERERGIYWCPTCQQYPWGSGMKADTVPAEAWPSQENDPTEDSGKVEIVDETPTTTIS